MKVLNPKLLERFRRKRRCEWCGKAGPAEPHHWHARGMGGGSQLDIPCNLIALCRRCHDLAHWGHIQRFDLLAKIAAREGMLQDQVWQLIMDTLAMPKEE